MISVTSGKSSALFGIGGGNDISLRSIDETNHRVYFENSVALGSAQFLLSFLGLSFNQTTSIGMHGQFLSGRKRTFFFEIGENAPDGGNAALIFKQSMDFLFAQTRMESSEFDDSFNDCLLYFSLSPPVWRFGESVQSL